MFPASESQTIGPNPYGASGGDPYSAKLVAAASGADQVVLDGEAHGWLVIDPKGLVGERGFEYANLFRNPDLATALAPGRMRRRIEIVTQEGNLDRRRLLDWVVAYAGLGAAWSLEDGDDPTPGLAIAEQAAAIFI